MSSVQYHAVVAFGLISDGFLAVESEEVVHRP